MLPPFPPAQGGSKAESPWPHHKHRVAQSICSGHRWSGCSNLPRFSDKCLYVLRYANPRIKRDGGVGHNSRRGPTSSGMTEPSKARLQPTTKLMLCLGRERIFSVPNTKGGPVTCEATSLANGIPNQLHSGYQPFWIHFYSNNIKTPKRRQFSMSLKVS